MAVPERQSLMRKKNPMYLDVCLTVILLAQFLKLLTRVGSLFTRSAKLKAQLMLFTQFEIL